MTLWRKRKELGICNSSKFSNISDMELRSLIVDVVGERMLIGMLRSREFIVQRSRICEIVHEVDHLYVGVSALQENHIVFPDPCHYGILVSDN